jgi:hypothetical protein
MFEYFIKNRPVTSFLYIFLILIRKKNNKNMVRERYERKRIITNVIV